MLTLQDVVEAIQQRAEGRYDVRSAEAEHLELPCVELSSAAYRLKRSRIVDAGWRTILLAELPLEEVSVQAAFRWAADVRDVLPEPETADLYMFLVIAGISQEEAARIETDDRFCRKVVARESECPTDFLDRTFLAALEPPGDTETLSDPLMSALSSLSAAHPWTSNYLDAWKESLLSKSTGADVAQSINTAAFGGEGKNEQA
ncbi:ABC-three component system middle component 1 [Pseudomonas aeruginosa]|uniref:ABC-three component system middle component 1 n=1 Tax=Pseudomonas aeruginosa TaxID=287 RepID=UPI0022377DDA|nr:ABC-three component system middle component 1 [Pseudomonas aeruginosa]MCW4649626.1 hypothetical protein [Pseudomonas aeruginosa]